MKAKKVFICKVPSISRTEVMKSIILFRSSLGANKPKFLLVQSPSLQMKVSFWGQSNGRGGSVKHGTSLVRVLRTKQCRFCHSVTACCTQISNAHVHFWSLHLMEYILESQKVQPTSPEIIKATE